MRHSTALVSQYLENISPDMLKRYQRVIRNHVRGRNGIYAIYRKDKIYYVGLAKNLRGRLHSHLKDHHARAWDRFSIYLTIGNTHLRELESLLLRIVRPRGNRQTGHFHRNCQNLKNELARELRNEQRSEMNTLLGRSAKSPKLETVRSKRMLEKRPVASLVPFVKHSFELRRIYKKKMYRAKVRRDGMIRLGGKLYKSPSQAGEAVRGKPTNGWLFWQYERAPGDWVLLTEMRSNGNCRVRQC